MARTEFAELRVRFYARSVQDDLPSNHLFMILKKLDLGEDLVDTETTLLKKGRQYGPLASHCEHRFAVNKLPWDAINGCSFWRKSNPPQPYRGLHLVDRITSLSETGIAAAWTTRGGAMKDLNDLDGAERSGLRAIELEETYHPHNLLGSVYIRKNDPDAGARHYLIASNLGAPDRELATEVEYEMHRADPTTRKRVAEYFLSIDSQKYSWATAYL